MKPNLYFDFCSSSPIHPDILMKFIEVSRDVYSNPSSTHLMGIDADNFVNNSRSTIANTLNVQSHEVFFTSGATESNNLAILGTVRYFIDKFNSKPHIITSAVEHSSVYNSCKRLEEEGVELSILPVDINGCINIEELKNYIKDNTILISIMHVNNETGVIQPIEEIGEITKKNNILFHVDGVQGLGRIKVDLNHIDLYTISGHKIGAPKGIGVLIVKENTEISPIMYGGGQEKGIRPGTVNVPSAVCMAEAIKVAIFEQERAIRRLTDIYHLVRSKLETIPEIVINSPSLPLSSPHILNFSFPGVPSAILISMFEKKGIIVSSQSACSSKSNKMSRILMEMTHDEEISSSSIRLSFHESTTNSEINHLVEILFQSVDQITKRGIFSFILEEEQSG